jgi:hypothetical protein
MKIPSTRLMTMAKIIPIISIKTVELRELTALSANSLVRFVKEADNLSELSKRTVLAFCLMGIFDVFASKALCKSVRDSIHVWTESAVLRIASLFSGVVEYLSRFLKSCMALLARSREV